MLRLHPQHLDLLQNIKHKETHNPSPQNNSDQTDAIPPQTDKCLMSSGHENTVPLEYVNAERSPKASDAVDGNGVQRVIDAQTKEEIVEEQEERTRQRANDDGGPRVEDVAPGA